MSRKISDITLKSIFAQTGGLCAYEKCENFCLEVDKDGTPIIIGEIAHIDEYSENAIERPDTPVAKDKNHISNLIPLCPNCHTRVDKDKKSHPGTLLIEMKEKKISWVRKTLTREISQVTDEDIENLILTISASSDVVGPQEGFDLMEIQKKIDYNSLSKIYQDKLLGGIAGAGKIRIFLERKESYSPGYSDLIANKIKLHYSLGYDLKNRGDELYEYVVSKIQPSRPTLRQQLVVSFIMAHFFSSCQIFEYDITK